MRCNSDDFPFDLPCLIVALVFDLALRFPFGRLRVELSGCWVAGNACGLSGALSACAFFLRYDSELRQVRMCVIALRV